MFVIFPCFTYICLVYCRSEQQNMATHERREIIAERNGAEALFKEATVYYFVIIKIMRTAIEEVRIRIQLE